MEKTVICVRDVNEQVFRKFRALTVEEKTKLGEALTRAMLLMIKERAKKEKPESSAKNLLKVRPIDFGFGSEKTSKEVDKILYRKS